MAYSRYFNFILLLMDKILHIIQQILLVTQYSHLLQPYDLCLKDNKYNEKAH